MYGTGCKIMGEVAYRVRYGIVPAREIFNLLHPGIRDDWDRLTPEMREKRARSKIDRRNRIDNFYKNLEESVLRDGIRNPIATNAGKVRTTSSIKRLPAKYQSSQKDLWVCDFQGGSRLYYAQKYDLMIPCFIADHVDRFTHLEETDTAEKMLSKFRDKPHDVRLYHWGVYFHCIPNVHMGK